MTSLEDPFPNSVPLLLVERGGSAECVHRGSVAIVKQGAVVDSFGDISTETFYRSTAKPFQAMVAVTSGAADAFDFDARELSIAAGSHNAASDQLDVVRSMLAKAGVSEDHLRCGGHLSIDKQIARAQTRSRSEEDGAYPALWSNCSGKHAAMLATARAMDEPLETYLDPEHPVQQAIHDICAAFAREDGTATPPLPSAIDGCGAPIVAVSLLSMARSLARLGDPRQLPSEAQERYGGAAERVTAAMAAHPHMVGGERRFDTDLMVATQGRVLAKAGAEGVHGVAIPTEGLGMAVKVDDGSDRGYRLVVIELLRRMGSITDDWAETLAETHGAAIRTMAGDAAGRLRVAI